MKILFLKYSIEKILLLLFVSISFTNICIAQKVKIKKILDSNLFELTDGRLIKLAGVDVPNINHKDTCLQEVGTDAFKYARLMLQGKRFELTYSNKTPLNKNFTLVQIIKEYPFLSRDFTKEYLERGFGKFLNNVDTLYYQNYLRAENKAKNDKVGIWELGNICCKDTLDQFVANMDSNFIEQLLKIRTRQGVFANLSKPVRTISQLLFGPIIGGIFAIPGVAIENALFAQSGCGHPCIRIYGAYIGYVIGTSTWVYIAGGGIDRQLSYILTLFSGIAGTALPIVLAKLFPLSFPILCSFLLSPLISAIIYTNTQGTNNSIENINSVDNFELGNNNITHQDYYNSTKVFEINLFKINF